MDENATLTVDDIPFRARYHRKSRRSRTFTAKIVSQNSKSMRRLCRQTWCEQEMDYQQQMNKVFVDV